MQKIKKGDDVIVLTGKDKGKQGVVLRLVGTDRAMVENINMVKKNQKPNPNRGESGGIVDKNMSIHISNIGLYDPVTKQAGKVGFKSLEDGKKVRFFRSNNEIVDV